MPHPSLTSPINTSDSAQALANLLICHQTMYARLCVGIAAFVRANLPNLAGISWDVEQSYDDQGGMFTTIDSLHATMFDGRLVHLATPDYEWSDAIDAQIDEETDPQVKASLENLLDEGCHEACMAAQSERMGVPGDLLEQLIEAVTTLAYMDTSTTDLTFQTTPIATGEIA